MRLGRVGSHWSWVLVQRTENKKKVEFAEREQKSEERKQKKDNNNDIFNDIALLIIGAKNAIKQNKLQRNRHGVAKQIDFYHYTFRHASCKNTNKTHIL